ncbi:MAG: hypothetical protein MUQ30_10740 [Anaerolineae bacterium]|nr:hypothetical protein [Anaerolineae bacterium]
MSTLPEGLSHRSERFAAWIATYNYARFREAAQNLELRRNAIAVLAYVRDHKVIGTQSTGNMPRKHIRAVTADFITPPVLDQQIGDRIYKLRTEFEVWPLLFIHGLLEVADFLVTPNGAQWQITGTGERFLEEEPLFQTLSLFSTWWHRVDWRFATGHSTELPRNFPTATSAYLLSQPIGRWIEFETFATTLGQRTGLSRALPNPLGGDRQDVDRGLLLYDVRRMVTDRLIDFGVAEGRYREEIVGPISTKRIDAFKLTWLGKALLEGLTL